MHWCHKISSLAIQCIQYWHLPATYCYTELGPIRFLNKHKPQILLEEYPCLNVNMGYHIYLHMVSVLLSSTLTITKTTVLWYFLFFSYVVMYNRPVTWSHLPLSLRRPSPVTFDGLWHSLEMKLSRCVASQVNDVCKSCDNPSKLHDWTTSKLFVWPPLCCRPSAELTHSPSSQTTCWSDPSANHSLSL